MVEAVVVLSVRVYKLSKVFASRDVEEKGTEFIYPLTLQPLLVGGPPPPLTQTPNFISQSLGFLVFHFVLKKKNNRHNIKNTNVIGRG